MPNGVPMAWTAYHEDLMVYIAHGEGPGFTDLDGFAYLDFNASDMAMFWLANRGIWDALPGAGPTVCVPVTRAGVARHVDAYAELLTALR